MLPADWNPIDSLAVLMLAVAAADAEADRVELDAITERLRLLAPKAPERAEAAVHRALQHWVLELVPGVGREPGAWVEWHCTLLAERYPDAVRRRFVMDMVTVARASGGPRAAEIELAAAMASAWGMDALAASMVAQFQQATRSRRG